MQKFIKDAIRDYVAVPPHIMACAQAINYDLLHGPSWSAIPKEGITAFTADHFATLRCDLEDLEAEGATICETYTGPVADALRDFIRDLPTLYIEDDSGCVTDCEPEGEWINEETFEPCDRYDEGAEYQEPLFHYTAQTEDIVHALFSGVIAQEFDF